MKSFFIIVLLVLLTTSSFIIYNTKNYSKSDSILFKSLIHSNIEEIADLLDKDSNKLLTILKKENIIVLNKKQSITQIALFNKKESAFIMDLLIKDLY